MQVDVVLQRVFRRIVDGQLDVVALVHHHQGAGNRTVEGQRLNPGVIGHLHFLLDERHLEFDDLGAGGGDLFMLMHERRCNQLDLAAGQGRKVDWFGPGDGRSRLGSGGLDDIGGSGGEGRTHLGCTSGEHLTLLVGPIGFLSMTDSISVSTIELKAAGCSAMPSPDACHLRVFLGRWVIAVPPSAPSRIGWP